MHCFSTTIRYLGWLGHWQSAIVSDLDSTVPREVIGIYFNLTLENLIRYNLLFVLYYLFCGSVSLSRWVDINVQFLIYNVFWLIYYIIMVSDKTSKGRKLYLILLFIYNNYVYRNKYFDLIILYLLLY